MVVFEQKIPIVVITSTALRHKFLANYLSGHFKVAGIVSEEKKAILQMQNISDETIKKNFSERADKEKFYFGEHQEFKIKPEDFLAIPSGSVNEKNSFNWINERRPKYLILFGSSIIKPPILDFYKDHIINMHLGLSPYYRGSGTNFWPLVFREPAAVGATIHIATVDVDAGDILSQVRPEGEVNDGCHDLGCKTIIAGAHLLPRLISAYEQHKITPTKQDLSAGRVFRNKDVTAEVIEKMWHNFATGMMAEYLKGKDKFDKQFPIIGRLRD